MKHSRLENQDFSFLNVSFSKFNHFYSQISIKKYGIFVLRKRKDATVFNDLLPQTSLIIEMSKIRSIMSVKTRQKSLGKNESVERKIMHKEKLQLKRKLIG